MGAGGEGFDGLAEVVVGIAFCGEPGGEFGQNMVEVEAVGRSPGLGGQAEIEQEEGSAGSEGALDFCEGLVPRGHVAESEGDGDGIEGGVGEGELEGVSDQELREAFGLCDAEHGLAEIGSDDGGARAGALEGEGEVAAAGGQVKDAGGVSGRDDLGGAFAPEDVESQAQEMVGEVVALGDSGKVALNVGGLDGSFGGHGGKCF